MPVPWLMRKLVRLATVLFAVTVVTFFMVDVLPGDVADSIGGGEISREDLAGIRSELGLDRDAATRYRDWIGRVLRGDLGRSYLTGEPVRAAICARLPVTIELIVFSQVLALLMAVPAGMLAAYRSNSTLDRVISAVGFATLSIPGFVMALVFIYVFSLRLQWLPATGFTPISEGIAANLKSLLLPALSIALLEWVVLMRVLRSDMITTLQQDYILLARAKGLPPWKVLWRHGLRASSFTMVTLVGLQMARHLGEAVVIETIFTLPGVGRLFYEAIGNRDTLVVQGCVLLIAAGYVTINALIDMIYPLIDPRIRTHRPPAIAARRTGDADGCRGA